MPLESGMTRPVSDLTVAPGEAAPCLGRLRALPSPARKPHWPDSAQFSLLENLLVDDFRLTTRLPERSGSPTAADLWLVFGYGDDQNFYLLHLQPSEHESTLELLLISGGKSTRLAHASSPSPGKSIRLERSLRSGAIHVLLDGGSTPVLSATDHTFGSGLIGQASIAGTWRTEDTDLQGTLTARPALLSAS